MIIQLTDADGGVPKTGNPSLVESIVALKRPRLVCVVEKTLPVVRDGLSVAVDHDGRIVIFWTGRPLARDINLFGIADDDVAVVLESRGASPQGCDARAGMLEKRRDLLQRLEIITY